MVLRSTALLLALAALALLLVWTPVIEKHSLQVAFPDGSPATGLELTWLAEGGRMGRAVETAPGAYAVHADSRAVELLGESVADQLVSWNTAPPSLEVARPAELEVFVTDAAGQPIAGVPLLLLPDSVRQDYEGQTSHVELQASRWFLVEQEYAQNQSFRAALEVWHAVDRGRPPGEVGWAERADGSRLWELDADVATSPTERWCPAVADVTYARSDELGRAHFTQLPLGWEGFAVISSVNSASELLERSTELGTLGSGARNLNSPWSPVRPDGAPGVVLDLVLGDAFQRKSVQLLPTGSLRGRFSWPKGAGFADVDLGRKLGASEGTFGELRFRGPRNISLGLPHAESSPDFEYSSLSSGQYVLVATWPSSGPPRRDVLWLARDIAIDAGEALDLGALSVPQGGGLLIDVSWETPSGVVPQRVDIAEELRLMLSVDPADGSGEYSLPLTLDILWPSSEAGAATGPSAEAPRAFARVIGLPPGRVHLQALEPYRGRNNAGVWQLDPAFGGVEVGDSAHVELTLPLVPR